MSFWTNITAAATAPIPVEEQIALADELLREGAGGSGSFFAQHAGWLSFLGLVVLAVTVMMIILAGRYRRRGDDFAFQEEPLFEDEMATAHMERYDDRYAEVVIEDEPQGDGFAQVLASGHEFDGHGDDREEEDSMMEEHEEIAEEQVAMEEEEEASPNVVPLRAAPEEPQYEAAAEEEAEIEEEDDDPEPDDHVEEQAAPRYAFATGRASTAETSFVQRTEPEMPRHGGAMASGGGDERDRPYVAPFIRDDIERSERRQSDRIDRLRDDFAHQFDTMKAEQSSRLDLVIAAIDRKLDSLDRKSSERATPAPYSPASDEVGRNVNSLNDQVQRISASIDSQSQRIRAITQILETKFAEVGRVYDEVKTVHEEVKSTRSEMNRTGTAITDVRGDLDEVKEHVGRLERAILDRAAQDSSTTVRLADVVRGTLPDGSYEFGATLANGETADCLIRFEGLRHRIAVDGGFPMEAFHELPSRDAVRRNMPQAKTAEDGFRRAILRSILEAADRCISPGETADSCLLFLPSEAAYTILHDRFPDLVRDSQRARVWLVSPSTLMGTLHLVKSLLPDQGDLARREAEMTQFRAQREEDSRLREEVEALRQRASTLAEELERTRGTLRGLIAPAAGHSIEAPAPAPTPAPKASVSRPEEDDDARSTWGGSGFERAAREHERPAARDADRYDDDEIIESLSFEGTPDWQSPLGRDTGKSKPAAYESGREGPLR